MISNKEIERIIREEGEGPTLDYKEELVLQTEGNKGGFVKDVISLANSGEEAHIIIGVEDGTRKLVGMENSLKVEYLNQILTDKADPPLRIEYKEINIMGHRVGVIEIDGTNPPYVVAVHDRYGGIERGTVFVRNFNMNEGATRADIDRIYDRMKPIILESDIGLGCDVSVNPEDELVQVTFAFKVSNSGDAMSADAYIFLEFINIENIKETKGKWKDLTKFNEGRTIVSLVMTNPVVKGINVPLSEVIIQVKKETKEIEVDMVVAASNMRTRRGRIRIPIVAGFVENIF